MTASDEYPIVPSPFERRITRDGVSVDVQIYRGVDETGWLLEIVDHLGGSTVWEDTFPSDEVALAEAMETIDGKVSQALPRMGRLCFTESQQTRPNVSSTEISPHNGC